MHIRHGPFSSWLYLTGQIGTGPRVLGKRPNLSQSLLVQIFRNLYLISSVYCDFFFCRFLFSACIDTATLYLSVSWINSQTHLYPKEWHQCWWLRHLMVPADAGEPSLVFPVLLLRLRQKLGSGIANRFSGSKDTSENVAHLYNSRLQVDDEADYYFCAISESNTSHNDTGR